MFVGTPRIAGADVVAANAGGLVYARVAGEDDFGAGPAIAVSGLLVLTEMGFREGLVDVRHLFVSEHGAGKNNRELPPGAVASVSRPAGMAIADQPEMVNANLDDVDDQPLPLPGLGAVAAG